jgi:hypothetical protein
MIMKCRAVYTSTRLSLLPQQTQNCIHRKQLCTKRSPCLFTQTIVCQSNPTKFQPALALCAHARPSPQLAYGVVPFPIHCSHVNPTHQTFIPTPTRRPPGRSLFDATACLGTSYNLAAAVGAPTWIALAGMHMIERRFVVRNVSTGCGECKTDRGRMTCQSAANKQ